MWLRPKGRDKGTILSFYDSQTRLSLSVGQEIADLVLERHRRETIKKEVFDKVYIPRVLQGSKPIFLTIASSASGTAVYADGLLVRTTPGFSIATKELARQLIVGDSAGQRNNWSGEFRGLAIYPQELTAPEALRDYKEWTQAGRPQAGDRQSPVAIYLFAELQGNIAHSSSQTDSPLYLPTQYSVMDKTLLETPWNAYRPDFNYWYDIAINIGGFIPFGLFSAALFALLRPEQRPVFLAILAGTIISLTIESLQWFLPTRDSDMTDVLTNTLGTCIGAGMLRWKPARWMLDQFLIVCDLVARKIQIGVSN
jgi:VanZ family protein